MSLGKVVEMDSYLIIIHASLLYFTLKVSGCYPNPYASSDVLRSIGKNDFRVVVLLRDDVRLS